MTRVMVSGPRRATTAICAVECGAKCCRGGGVLTLSETERRRLEGLAGDRRITFRYLQRAYRPRSPGDFRKVLGPWELRFREHEGEQCPFLDEHHLCAIYQDRPAACRAFPMRPEPACLLWPKEIP